MAELRIPIIVENKGKKAFKEVDNSVKSLTGNFKKLAGAAGIGLSTAAIINFGKQGILAFAENEKSARRLAGVVKNLGLELETPTIEATLDRISAKYGYQGEVLRDSYQKLITATGSLEKSQELLNLSLDVAAGSGQELLTVNQDLANAFVGNTRGLRKYNLGLSQAQLKTLKYEDAVALLAKTFAGAGQGELETFSGQMRILTEAADNAQEIIGGGLIDALMILSGDTTVEELAKSMAELATNTSTALTQLSSFGKGVIDIFGGVATAIEKFILATDPFVDLIVEGDPSGFMNRPRPTARRFFEGGQDSVQEAKRNKARALAEADALKAAKARAALEKKAQMDARKKAALEKAARTLELERINLTAGLKGKISETDRLSLQLQLALLDKNDTAATRLSAELDAAVKRQNSLNASLLATPEAPNPYRNWKVPEMGPLGGLPAGVIAGVNPSQVFPEPAPVVPPTFNVPSSAADSLTQYGPLGGLAAGVVAGVNPQPVINVVVEVAGEEVAAVITQQQTNQSLSGSFVNVNRLGRFANVPVAI
jgi:hypothetical protein